MRQVAPDNQYLVTRIELYLGSTLREMKRYDEAKKLLVDAQKGVKDEALPELAELAAATGDNKSALAYYKKSLDDDEKQLPKGHPDVVADRMMYAETLMAMGQLEPARAQLELADEALDDDMSPFTIADVSFDLARVLWLTRPDEQAKALQLARRARRIYATSAPKTDRYQSMLAKIDKWLGDEADRRLAAHEPPP